MKKNSINITFWFLIGFTFGAMICYIFIQSTTIKVDSNLVVNIFLALCAFMAILLTIMQIELQRQHRIWDINKPILLELMHLLSEVIDETEKILEENYLILSIPNAETTLRQSNLKVYDALNKKINNILSVYQPIISNDLIQQLKQYKTTCNNIVDEFNNDDFSEFDPIEGYEKQLDSSKALYMNLNNFIKKIAGV
jgi:hypothetical protein